MQVRIYYRDIEIFKFMCVKSTHKIDEHSVKKIKFSCILHHSNPNLILNSFSLRFFSAAAGLFIFSYFLLQIFSSSLNHVVNRISYVKFKVIIDRRNRGRILLTTKSEKSAIRRSAEGVCGSKAVHCRHTMHGKLLISGTKSSV